MTHKTAFVFPGQGSQSVGMLANLAAENPIIQETFEEASVALGYDLWALAAEGPKEKLDQTEFTQPAILTASVALWRLWLSKGKEKPQLLAGHSLGEYSALVCVDALNFKDAVLLVALRGRLMQSAVPAGVGAMAAILGLDAETIKAICQRLKTGEVVFPANYNTPEQTVIAGHKAAVEWAMHEAEAAGAKRAIPLTVSAPSHCELMKPAALLLQEALESVPFQLPNIPVIHNVDVRSHDTLQGIRQALVEQLYKPVRWVETVRQLAELGSTEVFECGPGAVLSGLSKRIVATLPCQSLSNGETYVRA
jgi:[acyl-carrier-protein] S-malonyltransferase